uniref:Fatty acid synthase n=1 Tax=Dermatophagoides pteronyssinus TaxID=6956 RepID=A0A6P6XK86_DERPT|nr:uncharacterized protein LOC113788670 [Dermatophagoides pteronyssinus]
MIIIPGVLILESMVTFCEMIKKSNKIDKVIPVIDNLVLHKPFVITEEQPTSYILKLDVNNNITLYSSNSFIEDDLEDHVTARLMVCVDESYLSKLAEYPDWAFDKNKGKFFDQTSLLYDNMAKLGLEYGPKFRTLQSATVYQNEAVGELKLALIDELWDTQFKVHPSILDGALHLVSLVIVANTSDTALKSIQAMVPYKISKSFLGNVDITCLVHCHIRILEISKECVIVNVSIIQQGKCVTYLDRLTLKQLNIEQKVDIPRELLWCSRWELKNDLLKAVNPGQIYKVIVYSPIKYSTILDVIFDNIKNKTNYKELYGNIIIEITNSLEDLTKFDDFNNTTENQIILYCDSLFQEISPIEILADCLDLTKWSIKHSQDAKTHNKARCAPIYIFTNSCQALYPDLSDIINPPYHAGVIGFFRSVRAESVMYGNRHQITNIDINSLQDIMPIIANLVNIRTDETEIVFRKITKETKELVKNIIDKPVIHEGIQLENYLEYDSKNSIDKLEINGQSNSIDLTENNELPENTIFLFGRRIAKIKKRVIGYAELYMKSRGSISNLVIRAQSTKLVLPPNHVKIRVFSIGLNFRDILNVMDLYPGDPGPLGGDCSGIVISVAEGITEFKVGDKVFGIAPGCLKHYAITDRNLLCHIPNNVSFELASTLPVAAGTVEYALVDVAKIKPGQTVLIHAVTGAVGLYAFQLCKLYDCKVIGTCSDEKKIYAKNIGVDFVSCSRNSSLFQTEVKKYLQGNKIDVILNCLIGDFIDISVSLLSKTGVFLELGKRAIWSDEQMKQYAPGVKYHKIAVDVKMNQDRKWFQSILCRLKDRFEKGKLKPIAMHLFNLTDKQNNAIKAFRLMQRAGHIGKVVIRIPSSLEKLSDETKNLISTPEKPLFNWSPNQTELGFLNTVLITGGTGALGLLLANELICLGVKRIILISRSGYTKELETNPRVIQLLKSSCEIEFMALNLSSYNNVYSYLKTLKNKNYSIDAIFHLAGVLQDLVIDKQSKKSISVVYENKAGTAWNLHNACNNLSISLQHFVMFSSISSFLGNYKQTNYSAANAEIDALVQHRNALKLPGLSIQWGAWIEQGMALGMDKILETSGLPGLTNDVGLRAMLEVLSDASISTICVQNFRWMQYLQQYDAPPPQFTDVFENSGNTQEMDPNITNLSGEARKQYVLKTIIETASSVLGQTDLPPLDAPLQELGIDSLGAVELRNSLQSKLGVRLAATAMFDYPTLASLGDHINALVEERLAHGITNAANKEYWYMPPKLTSHQSDGVAITGISVHFPGNAHSLEEFWNLLNKGFSGVTDIPVERFNIDQYYDPTLSKFDSMSIRQSSFVSHSTLFDPSFFHITSAELKSMDPQQRLMLLQAYLCTTTCGYSKENLQNQNIGCFIGCCNFDWHYLDQFSDSPYAGVGGSAAIVSNRISYALGLKGPSLTVDTACSSSLVAIDIAINKILQNACDKAIVGGVNLLLTPHLFSTFSRARMLAPDSRCKTFDARADGYVRGEGCAAIYIEKSADAYASNKYIYAILRGSAVNHDGTSASLTAPNGPAQQSVIKSALIASNLCPAKISYIEAHGTGTALGDPIELGAIKAIFELREENPNPLIIGALKTNIGHLEGAAGVASLVKVVLCLQKKKVPRNLYFENINPHIDLRGVNFVFPKKTVDIVSNNTVIYAGLSSFGFGGANAHLVVESVPHQLQEATKMKSPNFKNLDLRSYPFHEQLHPLLGHYTKQNGDIQNIWSFSNRYFDKIFSDHCIFNVPVVAGVMLLESIAAAYTAEQPYGRTSWTVMSDKPVFFSKFVLIRPLLVPAKRDARNYLKVKYHINKNGEFSVVSEVDNKGNTFFEFAEGLIVNENSNERNEIIENCSNLFEESKICDKELQPNKLYDELEKVGYNYGPTFQTIDNIKLGRGIAVVQLSQKYKNPICPDGEEIGYRISPQMLDGAFHVVGAILELENQLNNSEVKNKHFEDKKILVPFLFQDVWIHPVAQKTKLEAVIKLKNFNENSVSVQIAFRILETEPMNNIFDLFAHCNEKNKVVGFIKDLQLRLIDFNVSLEIPNQILWKVQTRNKLLNTISVISDFPEPLVSIGTSEASTLTLEEALEVNYETLNTKNGEFLVLGAPKLWRRSYEGNELCFWSVNQFGEDMKNFEPECVKFSSLIYIGGLNHVISDVDVLTEIASIFNILQDSHKDNLKIPPLHIFTYRQSMETCDPNDKNPILMHSGIEAFVKSIMLEIESSSAIIIDAIVCDISIKTFSEIIRASRILLENKDLDSSCIINNDEIFCKRLVPIEAKPSGMLEVLMKERGEISNLKLSPYSSIMRVNPAANLVEVRIRAVSLNFRDVLNVLDLYPGDPGSLCSDFAGDIIRIGSNVKNFKIGDSVFGIAPGCLKPFCLTDSAIISKIPDNISYEEAAALPVIGTTVLKAFSKLYTIKKNDKVLIHAITGGVGLFALKYCLLKGAIVYGTAGSEEKKKFALDSGAYYVTTSRDAKKFSEDMKSILDNEKLDCVLNCLFGDYITYSLELVKNGGSFFEIGKRDIITPNQMSELRADLNYQIIAIDDDIKFKRNSYTKLLNEVTEFISSNNIIPPIELYNINSSVKGVHQAFDQMKNTKHIGKIVISFPTIVSKTGFTEKDYNYPNHTITSLITGGYGSLGLQLLNWLFEQGVRKFIIISRTCAVSEANEETDLTYQTKTFSLIT